MPWPKERRLEMVQPTGRAMLIQEPPVPQDPDSLDEDQTPTYNAYSADGEVTGEIVYVNFGMPADYEELEKAGVSVKGKIVLARYGGGWRGIKPKVAWEHGAIGCLIYSDPKDDGFYQGDVFPAGPYRPEYGVQRGSVMDMPIHTGDPLSPGWGAEPGGRKLPVAEARTILKIPVMPIAWGDAKPLLEAMRGPVAPEAWRGALPTTYRLGPGPAAVRLKLSFDWQNRPLYNVIVRITGSTFPDEWVIFGNHHDAWVNGADDPISGAVSLMEVARGLGELVKTGWKPKRTIVLALWDGEEWGLLGSTEWAEKHDAELRGKGVVYINTDGTGKGWLQAGGSHSLQQFITEVARDVNDPKTGKPVLELARRKAIDGLPEAERPEAEKDPAFRIAPLGSGSDFTPFLQHLTLASLNLGFGGDSNGGVYHSVYDSFEWYTRVLGRRFHLRPRAGPGDRHRGPPPVGSRRAAVPLLRHVRHAGPLRRRGPEAARREEGRPGHRLHAARQRRGGAVALGPGVREVVRGGARRQRQGPAGAAGSPQGGEPARLLVRAPARQREGAAAPRLVPAPDLRPWLLHRLRRQDPAADPRGDRRGPLGRGEGGGHEDRRRRERPGRTGRSRQLRAESDTIGASPLGQSACGSAGSARHLASPSRKVNPMARHLCLVAVLTLAACSDDDSPTGPSTPRVSFFVTSQTSVTGNLGGLAGADATCQRLAMAAGSPANRTWRAYLSVERGANALPGHARDRIGQGPWYNAQMQLVANTVAELHSRQGDAAIFLDERGQRVNGQWTGSPAPCRARHPDGFECRWHGGGRADLFRLDL